MKHFFVCLVLMILFCMFSQRANGQRSTISKSTSTPVPGKGLSEADSDPDLPGNIRGQIDKSDYLRLRSEHIGRLRGLPYPEKSNPRVRAIKQMEQQLKARFKQGMSATAVWAPLGPAPIPNGQTEASSLSVSGRVTAIAIHPLHPDTVYVGTAQGGVYRTFDGGSSWTPILDDALSLAIGAITIDPVDNTTVFVGTGEGNLSLDTFFGVGLYIVKNAETSPTLTGPFNLNGTSANVLAYRSISKVLVDPFDDNIVFVTTINGYSGLSGEPYPDRPARGLYRSTNAMSVSPTFEIVDIGAGSNPGITDALFEPGNPNNLLCAAYGQSVFGIAGGIYRTTNAMAGTPLFSQVLALSEGISVKFGINKAGSVVTVFAASGESGGELRKSNDGGQTWSDPLTAANGFCSPQCVYDIALAIDPLDTNTLYICGSASGYGGGASEFKKSTDGGATFIGSYNGLHADMHSIAIADPPNNNVIYVGNDGGIFRSVNAGGSWTSLNTTGFSATQFQSIALHPSDRYFTIGGTQDNGTPMLKPDNTWNRVDWGDGGFSAIDQNASNTTSVTMYHTYYNRSNDLIGYARILNVPCATSGQWTFHGAYTPPIDPGIYCDGTQDVFNGISLSDNVLFYAPLALGPGNPNTVYFGSETLYRSTDKGDNVTVVSQSFGDPISAIGISRQNDNVRIVGISVGGVYATTTGSSTLTDVTGSIPYYYVARAVIDPNNVNTAYVTLDGYGTIASPLEHVWKTTNLMSGTWTSVSNGLPDVPVNAFVVDPSNSNALFCGTDIGVYYSSDGGSNWSPYGSGLPRVAVFDVAIQDSYRILRIATHGKGIWEIPIPPPPTSVLYVQENNRWNLVSNPLKVSNDSVKVLFPTSINGTCYGYNGSYVSSDTIADGKGYWLKFGSAQSLPVSGYLRSADTIAVPSGWSLIGSISSPIATSSISSSPPGIITSSFYGYSNRYQVADTLKPGKGYWVKVNQSGSLVLSSSPIMNPANHIRIVETNEMPPSPPGETSSIQPLPKEFALEQNYPNPFNPMTVIQYQLPFASKVSLQVYDVLGQVVATLVDGIEEGGYKSKEWNGIDAASGLYFYRLSATSISTPVKTFSQIRKMVLIK